MPTLQDVSVNVSPLNIVPMQGVVQTDVFEHLPPTLNQSTDVPVEPVAMLVDKLVDEAVDFGDDFSTPSDEVCEEDGNSLCSFFCSCYSKYLLLDGGF